eukprot:CAMPEP_0179190696 /NCGR_PEP_ID=MMETSP0796-20121207/94694_1 /TAXON_ID=73915 /ORGANISM="Pyrodinium bahamense, Strain pbaha01" /LENGTH=171 /DNA_ID=CAMNT_0020894877 /DNA_START=154 /DNA_END=669 /DNA_ORIENTATION=+
MVEASAAWGCGRGWVTAFAQGSQCASESARAAPPPARDDPAALIIAMGNPKDRVSIELPVRLTWKRAHHASVALHGTLLLSRVQALRPVDWPQLGIVLCPTSVVHSPWSLLLRSFQDIHNVVPAPLVRYVTCCFAILGVLTGWHPCLDMRVGPSSKQHFNSFELPINRSCL